MTEEKRRKELIAKITGNLKETLGLIKDGMEQANKVKYKYPFSNDDSETKETTKPVKKQLNK